MIQTLWCPRTFNAEESTDDMQSTRKSDQQFKTHTKLRAFECLK